jgi:hypothetical protein
MATPMSVMRRSASVKWAVLMGRPYARGRDVNVFRLEDVCQVEYIET